MDIERVEGDLLRVNGSLTQAKSEILDMGGEVVAVSGDVGNWKDFRKIIRTAVHEFGRLDVLINNAGVTMRGAFVNSQRMCVRK